MPCREKRLTFTGRLATTDNSARLKIRNRNCSHTSHDIGSKNKRDSPVSCCPNDLRPQDSMMITQIRNTTPANCTNSLLNAGDGAVRSLALAGVFSLLPVNAATTPDNVPSAATNTFTPSMSVLDG